MTTLAAALKEEIRRLARKEIKTSTQPTVKAGAQYRRDIAALKRQVRDLEKKLAALQSSKRGQDPQPALDGSADAGVRFSARSVKAQRARTGLSAADYALLVGVSSLTIYNWEHGKSRPRKEQLASLVTLRGIGKREVEAKLKQLKAQSDSSRPKSRRARAA